MKKGAPPQHDNSYKLLFSHPQMVEDLLRGFVRKDWIQDVDFTSLEPVSGNFVSDDLTDRESDIIWRVRLLYQELARRHELTPAGKLPPVLPVVLYNGIPRWQAATDIAELVENVSGGLARYRPQMSYLLLDEGALDESEQFAVRNLAAALFRMEKSNTPEDMRQLVSALVEWLKAPEQTSLRRAFTVWINRVLLPHRMPGAKISDTELLDTAKKEEVLIKRRGGETFSLVYKKTSQSPFDIPGITTKATTADILGAIRESREG